MPIVFLIAVADGHQLCRVSCRGAPSSQEERAAEGCGGFLSCRKRDLHQVKSRIVNIEEFASSVEALGFELVEMVRYP